MTADDAKRTVIQMGKKLLHTKLTVRTWGNVSVRIDSENYAITPSGRGYENLKREDIVVLNINAPDTFGAITPSSERLLHAEIYKTNSQAKCIIHTHQKFASACAGCVHSVPITDKKEKTVLGDAIPCTKYAPAGSKELAHNIAESLKNEKTGAVLIPYHGAVCFGKNPKEVFLRAQAMETACRTFIFSVLPDFADFFNSYTEENTTQIFPTSMRADNGAAENSAYHTIYETYPEINCIELSIMPVSAYLSKKINAEENSIPAFLEDFAQIAGENIFCKSVKSGEKITADFLKGRNAVLIKNFGVLCCVSDYGDMYALKEICEKNFLAFLLSKKFKNYLPLKTESAKRMRIEYINGYSKRGVH